MGSFMNSSGDITRCVVPSRQAQRHVDRWLGGRAEYLKA
jgi:hypothetical protein